MGAFVKRLVILKALFSISLLRKVTRDYQNLLIVSLCTHGGQNEIFAF